MGLRRPRSRCGSPAARRQSTVGWSTGSRRTARRSCRSTTTASAPSRGSRTASGSPGSSADRRPEDRAARKRRSAQGRLDRLNGVIDVKVLRTDPDRVRASQRARGESEPLVDDLLAADEARRGRDRALRAAARRAEGPRAADLARPRGDESEPRCWRAPRSSPTWSRRPTRGGRGSATAFTALLARSATWSRDGVPEGGRGRLRRAGDPRARRATSPPRASSRATTSSSASCSARSTSSAGPRSPAPASTT